MSAKRRSQRGIPTPTSSHRLLVPLSNPYVDRTRLDPLGSNLSAFEDRRLHYPAAFPTSWKPATAFNGRPARLTPSRLKKTRGMALSWPSHRISFEAPARVILCVRRKQRREVFHAKGLAGGRGYKRPRRSVYSSISCR